ncbi:MAG: lamin tail domain-containing protein [Ginsengibacter sp.]
MQKKFTNCLFIFLLINATVNGQITDNFNDGNFINPLWSGNTSSFIINNSFQLQSNDSTENSTFYLASENHLCLAAQWEFWMRLSFNPSSANYIDIYLASSKQHLNDSAAEGYFVRAGNTQDDISLYRKDPGGRIEKIIDGEDGILDHSNNICKIKITRDSSGRWFLYRDLTGSGNSYFKEGSVFDSTYKTCSWTGFVIKQSTTSFFGKHYFDDFEIKSFEPDITPPKIISVTAVSPVKVDVLFDENIDNSSNTFSSYFVNNNLGMPDSVITDFQNRSLIHLVFSNSFINGYAYTLTINGIQDLNGNLIKNATSSFSFYTPQKYDVVIDEIFADPTPSAGLPAYEWIELKNTSAFAINLKGWTISDGSGSGGPLQSITLQPDSFLIVCAASGLSSLAGYGRATNISGFPSLDNEGELLSLSDQSGKVIHAVQYSSEWHENELKKNGGWSLEMIDPKNACNGSNNWTSSKAGNGGTPGKKNSVDRTNPDDTSPKLLSAFADNNSAITLTFDEPVDSLKGSSLNNYIFDNNLKAISAKLIPPLFNQISIGLNSLVSEGKIYNLMVHNISDCAGNIISRNNSARFGLPQNADSFDIVINEILFNPLPGGIDFVELYNRSGKIFDLSKISIANRNSNNVISSITPLTHQNILFFPKDFMVITIDPAAVKSQYLTPDPDAFIKITTLPSFPNDKGNVLILNNQGNIINEVNYSDKWHFQLMHNTKGVSLERIDYDAPSIQSNFHSAATSVGYGTPGYKNSQFQQGDDFRATITVTPSIFSPDNDGNEDFATINYNLPSPGYVANITVFDASGRPVRYLERNSLNGLTGYYRWDGLDDKGKKLPQGIYIIYTEIFNKEGKKKQFKNTIVLARKK